MSNQSCIFCSIASGAIPSSTVFENSEFKVILDLYPASKGHTLIIPKEHFDNIFDLDSDTASKLFAFATIVARALKNVLHCDGLNVIQNNGVVAGQTVNHFHMHLIPRFEGDGMRFAWKTQQFEKSELDMLAEMIGRDI